MDLIGHDRASIIAEGVEEEDRISKLPNNIIHHILSFLDMKYAVQTSKLSRKWKRIWTSMPCLNLHIHTFGDMSRFGKFVKCVLSHRKKRTQVSTVNFAFTGNPDTSVVNNFVEYVYSHGVKEMTLILFGKNTHPFSQSVFRSHTLKHLTIRFGNDYGVARRIPNSVWDFPALETLNLSRMLFGECNDKIVNLFSECVNLKDLTLHHCSMSHLDFFIVSAPNLLNLSITGDFRFPKVFNVVTPQLENLTASAISGFGSLRLSTEGFNSLEKVNLSSSCNYNIKRYILPLLKLFQKLRTAKFLILDTWIIQVLSLCLDKFSHIPCPFNNLRCLKIDTGPLSSSIYESDRIAKTAPQVRNYLLENSPNATFIMDLPQVSIAEEDRISKLPDNIIHHILSFLDTKCAVQTCKLSRKWKLIWASMPCLNLSIHTFGAISRFGKFVKRVLSHRNNHAQLSSVNFEFRGNPDHSDVNNFVKYVYSHNVKQMTLIWFSRDFHQFPQRVFSSNTLKHLTIRYDGCYEFYSLKQNSYWDFPALETLNLTRLQLGEYEDKSVNLFSKCVNLKDLTLHCCSMSCVDTFNVCAPQLLKLTITGYTCFPKVFNVVAPQLKNFTASVISRHGSLRLSTEGFDSLEKVNISSSSIHSNKINIQPLLDLFQKLRTAKVLILDMWIIEVLSLCLDQFFHIPCTFNNLRCLKIDMGPLSLPISESDHIAKMAPQVRNYLLENSPNATFIMDLPQVPPTGLKRPMQEVNNHTMANKGAKLDVPTVEPSSASKPSLSDAQNLLLLKVPHQISTPQVRNDVKKMANLEVPPMRLKRPMQTMHNDTIANKMAKLDVPTTPIPSSSNVPRQISVREVHNDATKANLEALETIPEDKITLLEAKIQMQEEVMAKQKAMLEAKIQMQDVVMAKQQAMFEVKIQMQDEVMAKQKAMFEAKIQMQDEVFAEKRSRFEAKTQMQDEVMAKQKAMLEAKIHMQDEVVAKEKEMLETKIQMQDEVIAKQKATFEAKAHMQDEIISKQKAMFEAKIEMQNESFAEQKVKVQMQDEVIANQKAMFDAKVQMLEAAKSQHEELMSHIIKWKIAELKVQVESGNPDHEIIRSIGGDIKSVMCLIPESSKLVMKAQFSFQYVEMKSMFFTRINASEWAKIESELASNI